MTATDQSDYPLVVSMTDIANYQRCRKLFHFSAVQNLSPRRTNDAVQKGLDFHELVAYYTRHGEWPVDAAGDMFDVAKAYIEQYPVTPAQNILAEKPFFVEALPNVWVRFTCDRITFTNERVEILDLKTFSKAPTLAPDLDFQAKTYLVLARKRFADHLPLSTWFEFVWHHVRNELGRFLKHDGKAVWTPWEAHERYLVNSLTLSQEEADLFERELLDCLRDIKDTISNDRYYRTPLKGQSPFTCGSCFYKSLCSQDAANGGYLSIDDIERLTEPPTARFSILDVTADPRIDWYVLNYNYTRERAARIVYGPLLKEYAA